MNTIHKTVLILALSLSSGFLLCKFLFPNTEVIRTVEKTIEVPAQLTDFQKASEVILSNIFEAESHKIGIGATAVYPATKNKVKVIVMGHSDVFKFISESEITARVESVFRRNGFTVEDGPYCETFIVVLINLIPSDDKTVLAGGVDVKIEQEIMGFAGGLWKKSSVITSRYGKAITYGSRNYYKIPLLIESLAIEACNDLSAAGPTEKIK